VGDLQLDTVSHKAVRADRSIELTAREYSLLEHFMRNAGKLITRIDLARDVWGYDFDPGTNIVDVYVNHLRKKIEAGHTKKLLHTERGRGYVLEDRDGTT
jgi:DNA-binding response OmpR family regulator